jgi:predicted unusual protein kinase regulating ubiquinone biosynthesis (AarF/ABC1/UbiB family)
MVPFLFDGQPLMVSSHISSKSSQVSLSFLPSLQGNILLHRDEDGSPSLGLIDFGHVKQLTKETRHLFARLVIALDNDDKGQVVSLMQEDEMKTKHMNPDVIYLYAKVSHAEINGQILKGKHVQLFMEDLES